VVSNLGRLSDSDRRCALRQFHFLADRLTTDIQLAPRNSDGKVMYTSTFSILKPVDMTKAGSILI
jgi:hypothetical protein